MTEANTMILDLLDLNIKLQERVNFFNEQYKTALNKGDTRLSSCYETLASSKTETIMMVEAIINKYTKKDKEC